MKDKKFILIGHEKRQGKDTFAQMLQKHMEDAEMDVEVFSFADPMREILADMFDLAVSDYKTIYNNNDEERKRIQRFGSNKMIEYFGEQVWRDVLLRRAEKAICEYVIVPDFRFNREVIDGALTMKVVGLRKDSDDTHQSEVELKDFPFDIIVHNDEGLAELDKTAKAFAENILTNNELYFPLSKL